MRLSIEALTLGECLAETFVLSHPAFVMLFVVD